MGRELTNVGNGPVIHIHANWDPTPWKIQEARFKVNLLAKITTCHGASRIPHAR